MGKNVLIVYILVPTLFGTLLGCSDNDFAFKEKIKACESPGTSARNSSNPGPIIEYPPEGLVTNGDVIVSGSCEPGFDVLIAGNAIQDSITTSCVNGQFSALITATEGDGTKSVQVSQATHTEMNIMDIRCFNKDTTPPVVEVRGGNSGLSTRIDSEISGICEPGYDVLVYGDSIASPVAVPCVGGTFSAIVQLIGADGSKTVEVRQRDAAGNIGGDSEVYIKDQTPPLVDITNPSPMALSQGPITVSGICETGLDVVFTGAGINTLTSTSCNAGAFSAQLQLSSGDGVKTLTAQQMDAAGNVGSDNESYIKDATPPAVAFTAPAENTYAIDQIQVQGTCEAGLPVMFSGLGMSAPLSAPCTSSGTFNVPISFSNGQGAKLIRATQADAAGNSNFDQRTFQRDSIAPVVQIQRPLANSVHNMAFTISGSCETGLPVSLSGGLVAPVTTSCTANAFSTSIQLSSPDGLKTVVASQTDSVGLVGTDSRGFLRDTTGPTVIISSPSPMSYHQNAVTIQGTCESGHPVVLNGGVQVAVTTSCSSNTFSGTVQLSAGDGTKTLSATQTDASGNIGIDSRDVTKDTTAPLVTIDMPAANAASASNVNLSGQCENGLNVALSGTGLTAPSSATCASGTWSANVALASPDGVKNIVASQTDTAGNTGSDNRNFYLDTTAPVVSFSAPAAGANVLSTVTVTGGCETGLTVSLSGTGVASATTTACTASQFTQTINLTSGDGTKNIVASQVDAVGNLGSANRSFTKDTTAPAVAITAPAPNYVTQNTLLLQGACEDGYPVTIYGAGSAATLNTACASGTFSQTVTLSAADGNKLVQVSQTDSLGLTGTDSRNFIKDTTAPLVTIDMPAANAASASNVNLSGQCENGLNVALSGTGLTAPSSATCASGAWSANVALASPDGVKNIVASQTDTAGNTGSDNRNFYLDTTAPVVSFSAPAAGAKVLSTVTVTGGCETGLTVSLSGTGVASATTTACAGSQFSQTIALSSGDGAKNIVASQMDLVGNLGSANRTVIKDSAAPGVAITAPAPDYATQNTLLLQGVCEDGYPVTIYGAGSAATLNTACASGNFSQTVTLSAADGNKLVQVSQTDSLGLTGTDSRNFIKDTTAPLVTIDMPAANAASASSVNLSGQCENGLNVALSGTGLTVPSSATCASGAWSANVALASPDGVKNIVASQTDTAGNTGSDNRNFYLDTTAPVVSFSAPAAGAKVLSTVTVTGGCETGLTVSLSGTGVASATTTACTASQFTQTINLTSGDGTKNIVASQVDAVGNLGSANRSFTKDTTAPAVAITAPAPNYVTQNTLLLQGVCEDGYPVTIYGAGSAATLNTACASGNFSQTVTLSAADGNKLVQVSQTDSLGLTGTDSRNFIKDTTAPLVTITAPAANSTHVTGIVLTGSCESGLPVYVSGNGIASTTTTCSGSSFSVNLNFSAGDGSKIIAVNQTDAAGNTGMDSRTFLRDSTGPALSIQNPASGTSVQSVIPVSGLCENGYPVDVYGTGVMTPSTASCVSGTFTANVPLSSGEGVKVVNVRQTDAVGNSTVDSRSFVRDNTSPGVDIVSPTSGPIASQTISLAGSCESGLTVALSGTGLVAAQNTSCSAGQFSATVTVTAGSGNKMVSAAQTDSAGNIGSDVETYVLDLTPPVILIANPLDGSYVSSTVSLSGSCETGLTVNFTGSGVASLQMSACNAGAFSAVINTSNGDGAKQILASQTDAAGNVGSDTGNYLRDDSAPVIAFTSPAPNTTASSGVIVQGSCEAGLNVSISGSGVSAPQSVACTSGAFSANVLFSSADGSKEILASQIDAAGNTGSASRTFIKDSTAPIVTIHDPAIGTTVSSDVILMGDCENGLPVSIYGTGVLSTMSVSCIAGSYSASVGLSAGDGAKVVQVAQVDAAGNTGTDSRNFVRDATPPAIAITAPTAGTSAISGLTVLGNCEAGYDVFVHGTGLLSPSTVTCTSGTFSAPVTFSAGDGNKLVEVSQTDAAGNIGSDSRTFYKDSSAPTVLITAPSALTTTQSMISLVGNCQNGLAVDIYGTGVNSPFTTTCSAATFSATVTLAAGDGTKTVQVRQTDTVGNVGTDSRDFIKDSTAPVITFTSPSEGTSTSFNVSVQGNCENGLNVNFTGDLSSPQGTACNSGNFATTVTLSAGLGSKTIVAGQMDAVGNVGSDSVWVIKSASSGFDSFSVTGNGKVDILFVNDNSASMDAEQAELASKFPAFSNELTGVDWQIGMITTDCSTGPYGFCGSLHNFEGQSFYVLDSAVPNYETHFLNTIQRPETLSCSSGGFCPSGREEPLYATIDAINKRGTDNAGFFRSDANLAVVILSDEDEQSNAPSTATTAQNVIDAFDGAWPTNKILSVYGIVVQQGDTSCLAAQQAQYGLTAFEGTRATDLANQTGGLTFDICSADYSGLLTTIGQDVKRLTDSFQLANTPIAGSVTVNLTPAQSVAWSVNGNRITFDAPLTTGTTVEVYYNY